MRVSWIQFVLSPPRAVKNKSVCELGFIYFIYDLYCWDPTTKPTILVPLLFFLGVHVDSVNGWLGCKIQGTMGSLLWTLALLLLIFYSHLLATEWGKEGLWWELGGIRKTSQDNKQIEALRKSIGSKDIPGWKINRKYPTLAISGWATCSPSAPLNLRDGDGERERAISEYMFQSIIAGTNSFVSWKLRQLLECFVWQSFGAKIDA